MAKGGLKKAWQTMIRFFTDKEFRNSSWQNAKDNWNQSFAGVATNSLIDKVTGTDLTEADKLQNIFNSEEAALQRDWSSQEAERARDWEEEMYAKYNSLSGKIAQAEKAGVNPMLAITDSAVSPMSSSSPVPSGASAHGGSPTSESFVNLIGQLAGLIKLKSEVNLNDSQANKNNAEAVKTSKESDWVDALSQAQLDNLVSSTEELSSRLDVNLETANKLRAEYIKLSQEATRISQITSAEKRALEAQAAFDEWQVENTGLFKSLDLGSSVLSTIVELGISLIEKKTKTTIVR